MTITSFIAVVVLAFGISARAGEGESDHAPAATASPAVATGEENQDEVDSPELVPISVPLVAPQAPTDGDGVNATPADAPHSSPVVTKRTPAMLHLDPQSQPRWYRLGSYAGMGIGGVALGVGVWQGLASRGARDEYAAARTQIDAWGARRRGEVAAERANGWLIGGGITVGIAAIVFALDLLDAAKSPPPKANAPRISVQGVTW